MNKILKFSLKIFIIALAALLAIVILVIGGLNIAKFFIYGDYYSIKDDVCKNPGLNDGFVCQGIAAADDDGVILVSGYMKDHSASRVYVTTEDNDCYYVELKKNGKDFTGHAGGIATADGKAFIASEGKIYAISLAKLLAADDGSAIDIGEGTDVNNEASFVYCDGAYLYVGEFHDGGAYTIVGHENQTAEGTHYAICSKYSLDDINTPIAVYSIRNKVQGICFTPDGKIVMSTSYGLADSVYYVYEKSEISATDETFDGAPLYYIDGPVKEIKGPAMAEGLDYYEGKVITLTESASNKYIFGKLFGANKIVGLDLNEEK